MWRMGPDLNNLPHDFDENYINGGKDSRQEYFLNDKFNSKNRQAMLVLPGKLSPWQELIYTVY